jgi:ATP-binding cassette subfamily B multidrug efflux pump
VLRRSILHELTTTKRPSSTTQATLWIKGSSPMWYPMNISDRIFRPFENLVRPFDLPLRVLPATGVWRLVWHFAQLFRGVLVAVAGLSVISAGIGLAMVWALAFVVDGVTAQGAASFVASEKWTLATLVFVFAVVDPVVTVVRYAAALQRDGRSMA